MKWNWQKQDWPHFTYDTAKLMHFEQQLLHYSGALFGAYKYLSDEDKEYIKIEIISNEALETSAIEGEYLDRDSLQSSIRRNFGLQTDHRKIPPGERGITELFTEIYKGYNQKLTHQALHNWHNKLMRHRGDLEYIGSYRGGEDPIQIISGPLGEPNVHFEAPPSNRIYKEMEQFIQWFNSTSNSSKNPLPIIIRSGISHLYFETIHPFEDGNGRIGRALSEKALAQGLGQPTLIALSTVIHRNKKQYYDALERANKNNELTDWLIYFSNIVIEALTYSHKTIEFLIEKAKMLNQLEGLINPRQKKLLLRMFKEGHEGFTGGLSAQNYMRITKASQPTTTRDLVDLVSKGALYKTGALKHTRYYLNIANKNKIVI